MTETEARGRDLLHWAKERPQRVYLRQRIGNAVQEWTYAQAADEALRMAAVLKKRFPAGSRILITGRNCAHWLLADAAIALAGHVSVGLYPKQSSDSVFYIAQHSEAVAVFIGPMAEPAPVLEGLPEELPRISFPYPEVTPCAETWDALVKAAAPLPEPPLPSPDTTWTLVYTSGTTGSPKGVVLTFGAGDAVSEAGMKVLPYGDDERFFSYMPLAHIFERSSVAGAALRAGGTITLLEGTEHFAAQLAEARPTRFCAVPMVWGRLQAGILARVPQATEPAKLPAQMRQALIAGLGLDRCTFAVAGAAPMPESLLRWYEDLGLPIFQGYGMTENFAFCSCNLPGANRSGSVGRPFPGVEVRIGADGEILTRHAGQMKGYFKEPERTKSVLEKDGWLHTGDLGRLDDDGYLYVTGRIKDQFKTAKGFFVMPVPLENVLARHAAVGACCVLGTGLPTAVAVVSLSDAGRARAWSELAPEFATLVDSINATVGKQERIVRLVAVDEAWTPDNDLLTPTLKIRRAPLEERYLKLAGAALEQQQIVVRGAELA